MIAIVALCAADTSERDCNDDPNAKWDEDECFCQEGFLPASYQDGGIPCIATEKALEAYCEEDPDAGWNEDDNTPSGVGGGCFCRYVCEISFSSS